VVVEASAIEEQGRPLFGVKGEVRSKRDLTEPTLLEMPDYLGHRLFPATSYENDVKVGEKEVT